MASVIEGFLVRLGFEVDSNGQAKFQQNLAAAGERVKTLAKGAVAVGAAMGAAFMKASSEVNNLYKASNFTGTSISGYRNLAKALENVGGNGSDVAAAFANMSQNIITMGDGYAGMVKQIAKVDLVDPRTGKLRDLSEVLLEVRDHLAEVAQTDPGLAKKQAEALGLGQAFDALMKKDFPDQLKRVNTLMGDFNAGIEKGAKATSGFMTEVSNFTSIVSSAFQSAASQIIEATGLDKTLASFNDDFAAGLSDAVDAEVAMIRDSDGFLDWAGKWLFKSDDYQRDAKINRLGKKAKSGDATEEEKAEYQNLVEDRKSDQAADKAGIDREVVRQNDLGDKLDDTNALKAAFFGVDRNDQKAMSELQGREVSAIDLAEAAESGDSERFKLGLRIQKLEREAAQKAAQGPKIEDIKTEEVTVPQVKTVSVGEDGQEIVHDEPVRQPDKEDEKAQRIEEDPLEAVRRRNEKWVNSRGMRLNNPGNLRASRYANGEDRGFSTFASLDDGLLAMAEQLKMYSNSGIDNVASIVRKYAPPSENNTTAYVRSVVQSMQKRLGDKGLDATTHLNLSDPDQLRAIVLAMIDHEQGAGASALFDRPSYDAAFERAAESTRKSSAVTEADKIPSHGQVTVNQSITIQGAADPLATGQAVASLTEKAVTRNAGSNVM